MANTALTTDFNVAPYYDDYDKVKEFYKILYRPGYAVQGRELTQSQTLLQKQIDRFGKHIFKEGSIVLPGNFALHSKNSVIGPTYYVKVKDNDNSNNFVNITEFQDETITGATSGITADINYVLDGTEASGNTKTIYVDYRSVSPSNSSIKTFQAGEVLTSNAGTLVVVDTSPTGTASSFRISEGVLFAKEHFIYFPTQQIIIDRYNDTPTAKVGFMLTETIVTNVDDASLLDPALESSNYSAPGADRFKISATLEVVGLNDAETSPDFVPLLIMNNGILEASFDRSQYNILQDEMAKRTYDESGHYYVRGFNVSLREHNDSGTNGGLLTSANGGNSSLLSVQISDGVGYAQGYEISKLSTSYLTTEKSLNYSSVNAQLASAGMGSYVTAKEFTGSWALDQGTALDLYDTAQTRLTSGSWSTGAQTGKKIGTARLVSVEYENGTMGTPSATYNIYLTDVKMLGSNNFSNVKSIYHDNASTADMGADIVLNSSNNAVLKDTALYPMLYYTGSNYTKTIKPSGISDTTFTYKTSTAVSNVASGTFNVALPAGASEFPYGTTTLSSSQKREIMITLNSDANVALTGTVSNAANQLIGAGGADFTKLNVGDKLAITGVSGVYYIQSIANASYLTLTTAVANTVSGGAFKKQYKNGDIIDLTVQGATGVTRSVSATPTQLSFDIKETLSTTVAATVTYQVAKTTASQINKTLKPDRFVSINCASAGTSGPFNLGFPDVYQIKEIRLDTGAFTSNTQGTDVTSSFILDNGQKDTFYDFATITPKIALTASNYLLVRLDYFEPDFTVGQGFFSIDSYPIDDANTSATTITTAQVPVYKSPTTGQQYDLRNHLDFRPIKAKTATDSTTVTGASTNPATSSGFNYDVNGMRIPAAFSQISFDYQYYLARKDVLYLDKIGRFSIAKGVPAAVPITPSIADDLMPISVMTIAPYPSLSLYYANILNRKDLACATKKAANIRFTMRDIGVLKERIVNLEYYASLSILEKSAVDMKILDTAGIDRFKNGIFVDTFTDHSLGATYNSDYRIVVDPFEKSIRPLYNMNSITYDFASGSNVTKTGDIVTLNYSEALLLSNPNVTTTRNTERITYRYVGKMTLTPSDDIFVDVNQLPDNSVVFGGGALPASGQNQTIQSTGKTWNAWQSYITGYKVYNGGGALVGAYSSAAEATAVAQSLQSTTTVTIETQYASSRTGSENFVITNTESHSLGDKVVDVNIVHYIKPQTIKIAIQGLKPYARFYTFFDNVNMSDYATPLTSSEYDRLVAGGPTISLSPAASEGSILTANADGNLWLVLRIPQEKKFYVGTKNIKITDSPTNTDDATSFSEGYFVAQGLVETKQNTILATRQVTNKQSPISQNRTDPSQYLVLPQIVDLGGDSGSSTTGGGDAGGSGGNCLAYAFKVKAPEGEEGAFITSVDLFVSEKHPTLGVWFEILETDASGQITRNQVPFSEVWYKNSEVPISTNGIDNPLKVTFKAPVFLQNNKMYALAIHPEAMNANYYFWASRIGETDINTKKPVNSRLYAGTTFTTNNGVIWDIVPDVDVVLNVYRASFVTNVTGVATLANKPIEKFLLSNTSASLTYFGNSWITGNKLTLSNISGGTIAVSDLIIGSNSAVNSAVITIGATYNMSNTGYSSGEPVTVRYANGTSKGITAKIASILPTANAVLSSVTESSTGTIAEMVGSNGLFVANDRIFDTVTKTYADITKINNYRYSVFDLEPSYLKFNKTSIQFSMSSYSNTGTPGSYVSFTPNENYYFSEEKAIFSRSNEVTSLSNNRTNQVQVSMTTTSNYLSPVLDLGRTQTIIVDNLINSNTLNETLSSGGELFDKYISKTITLAEGQDAEDMNIFLTSYRPPNSDVKVWVKILHAEDSDTIAQRPWIELEKKLSGDSVYSSLSNRNDFIEYQYGFPSANLTGSLGQVQYTNIAGTATFTGYKYFAVKVGLISDDSAIVPRVADLRVIALQI
jgi:hypothetical protein